MVEKNNMDFPQDLKYTKDHEWIRFEDNHVTIGVTDFAQKELGDIVYVEIETEGEELAIGEVFGTVEAVKTVSDLFMPLSGTVEEVNEELESSPETVNSDPYNEGWMVKIKMSNEDEVSDLLSAEDYKELVGA